MYSSTPEVSQTIQLWFRLCAYDCSDIFTHKSYVLYCALCFTVAVCQPLNKLMMMMMMNMKTTICASYVFLKPPRGFKNAVSKIWTIICNNF